MSVKINSLLKQWPRKAVVVQSWLNHQGITRQLAAAYEKSSWINRIGRGAFMRADDQQVEWTGGLYAIQTQMQFPIHVGGKTALQWQGYAHFLPLGQEGSSVVLFGLPNVKLPAWFSQYDWGIQVNFFTGNLFAPAPFLGLTTKMIEASYSMTLSAPERAIMECLYLIPQVESFEEAKLLMESLMTLRPHLVQALLEACQSVKVKRLFLFLAEKYHHTWFRYLDLSKLNLGKGKRVIGDGGHFNAKYQLSVPDRQAIYECEGQSFF